MTGQLFSPSNSKRASENLIDYSAMGLAKEMKLAKDSKLKPIEAIWSDIFQTIYADKALQQKVIQLATNVDPKVMKSTSLELIFFKVAHRVSQFFSNYFVRLIVGACVWYQINRLSHAVFNKIKFHYVPRLANKLINVASLSVMKQLNRAFKVVEKIEANRGNIFLGALALRYTVGRYIPQVALYADKVGNLGYLPQVMMKKISWIPFDLAWKVAGYSHQTQGAYAIYVANASNEKTKKTFEEGGLKAYTIWMSLVEGARSKGIPIFKS